MTPRQFLAFLENLIELGDRVQMNGDDMRRLMRRTHSIFSNTYIKGEYPMGTEDEATPAPIARLGTQPGQPASLTNEERISILEKRIFAQQTAIQNLRTELRNHQHAADGTALAPIR